jgi:hypothetical protein
MNSKTVSNININHILTNLFESKLDSNKEKNFIFDDTLKRHKYSK